MSTGIIVSYDGTPNDDDGLVLGGMLARAGGQLSLAYVRHSVEFDAAREAMAQHDAERRLETGATWLGMPEVRRHVVVSASTGSGLADLARREQAQMIVFGSDYRTTPGRVEPGATASYLLEGGEVAVAVAPSGLRARPDSPPGPVALAEDGDPAARDTALALARALGVELVEQPRQAGVGLVVIASATGAPDGKIRLSAASRNLIEDLRAAVLVLPRGHSVTL